MAASLPAAYRPVAVALAASAALHGAALVGYRAAFAGPGEPDLPALAYTATLEAAAPAAEATLAPAKPPAPRARPRPKPKNEIRPEETVAMLPTVEEAPPDPAPAASSPPDVPPVAEPVPPVPEQVALAQPAAPPPPEPAPAFRPDAMPAKLTIAYALTSSFVDGQAEYTWTRDGDRYEISGTAEASGFFTLFVEGRITQEATGTVTPEGLRPDRFTERRGDTPEEGLAFDWKARTVEFRRGDARRSGVLTGTTVDWLSMIFQLAHLPPAKDGTPLRVYTQRRLYEYRLHVVGEETLDLPLGRARTLHLRHEGTRPEEAVDVWLGVDQHYLPVKLRYPVARGRLMVEQTATSVSGSSR